MKLFNKTLYILGITAALASCDTLEQSSPSAYEPSSVYSNYGLARSAVDGIYTAYLETTAYRSDYMMYYGANTDIEFWVSNGDDERNGMCKYRILPTNSYLNKSESGNFYPAVYNSIERANLAIKYLKQYGDVQNDSDMRNLLGEAIIARALLYADVLNFYGEAPARFEPITKETLYVPKSDRDVIYKQLLSDLLEAAGMMEFDSQTTITRPGKACALGLYARLALQASGYALRPDEGKVNTGDPGTIRKSSDPVLQKEVLYPKALAALQQIIDSRKFSLFDNFEDLWHYYCNLKTSIGPEGSEVIFGLPFGDNRGHHIVHNGVPNKKYDCGSASGRKGVVPTFYFKYPSYDTRRNVTCCQVRWNENGDVDESNLLAEYCYFGKFRFDWMKEKPLKTKDGEDGAKFTYLRYADILLMAAEIANELDDLTEAKNYMKPVLQRAYHDENEVQVYLANLTNKEEFFQAVKDQRAFEFCGELLRKQDLIRWNELKKSLDQAKADMTDMKALAGAFEGYRDAIYWRYKDSDHNNVEIKFVRENQAEPSTSDGWNKKSGYMSKFSQKTITNLYLEDPDRNMYRPIPTTIINASLGSLKNDYGYTE